MAKTDSPFNDLLIAFHLLTRLPLPPADWSSETRPHARAAWAYPLVGLGVGTVMAASAWVAQSLGMSLALTALLVLFASIFVTGAMHEDGLADCADGFWGGWEPARRLEIMKDSQIGTYGVLALLIVTFCKWLALQDVLGNASLWVLLIAPTASRAAMVPVMEYLPHARASGLSHSTGQPGQRAVLGACALGAIAAIGAGIGTGLVLILVALAVSLATASLAKRKIAGQTGDVLGAVQSLTEACLLFALSTLLA